MSDGALVYCEDSGDGGLPSLELALELSESLMLSGAITACLSPLNSNDLTEKDRMDLQQLRKECLALSELLGDLLG